MVTNSIYTTRKTFRISHDDERCERSFAIEMGQE